MSKRPKIPESLYMEISERTNNGAIGREIQDWLIKEHDIEASLPTITKTLQKIRRERAEATKSIYAAQAKKTAKSDMVIVDRVITQLFNDFCKTAEKNDVRLAGEISKNLKPYLELRMKINGVNEEIDINVNRNEEDIVQDLLTKLGIKKDE